MSVKPGINYPALERGNEFWNRVRVPGSCYKSLGAMYMYDAICVGGDISFVTSLQSAAVCRFSNLFHN